MYAIFITAYSFYFSIIDPVSMSMCFCTANVPLTNSLPA